MLYQSLRKGFTLIELLVSVAIFSVVLTIAVGALLVLIDANAKAQNMQEAMTNITFALDSMTREIRTGYAYYCSDTYFNNYNLDTDSTRDCPASNPGVQLSIVEGGSSLTSQSASGRGSNRIGYRILGGRIYRQVGVGASETFFPLTSDDVTITDMSFVVTGSPTWIGSSNIHQPTVTIYIKGNAGEVDGLDTEFSMQTTVTQRVIDI